MYFGTTRCFDTLGREGSGRVSIFIARHCAPDTSARPFASLARGCGQTVGELSAGGEGQQRGAAARSAGADRGGAAAAAASRASLRACPCLDDVERDQKIHLLPASTPTSPWHHNRCQHFLTFCPTHSVYPRVSKHALPCSADAFPLVLKRFARTSGSVPLGIRCRWYFCHMRVTGLDRLTRCSPRNELGSRLLLVH